MRSPSDPVPPHRGRRPAGAGGSDDVQPSWKTEAEPEELSVRREDRPDGLYPLQVQEFEGSAMEQVTFHYDTVLSDIHMQVPSARHLMTRLNHMGQPVFVSRFKILMQGNDEQDPGTGSERDEEPKETEAARATDSEDTLDYEGDDNGKGGAEPSLDEDGDLDVTHRPRRYSLDGGSREWLCPVILKHSDHDLEPEEEEEATGSLKDFIRIEHTMATPLNDVGKQVWRGAFLLSDFILSKPDMFRGATVLELGGGTGFTSVVMASTAKTVYCTDVGDDLLNMCQRNVELNKHLWDSAGEIKVRQLDWLQRDLCTDAEVEFSWTEEEAANMYDNTTFIIAADICYDDDLTDGLFRTLYQLCSSFSRSVTVFISVEKRMNFSLRDLDVSCEAYNHFRTCLSQLQELEDGRCSFRVEQLPTNFTQHFVYERIEHLELWSVTVSFSPAK